MVSAISTFSKDRLAEICRKHHVSRLRMFGSFARGDYRPNSDVDLLVEFDPTFKGTYIGLADLEDELSGLFGHRTIDLVFPERLHWYVRDDVLATAVPIYEG